MDQGQMTAAHVEELLQLQRRQALRLDQLRVMLGVLLGVTLLLFFFGLAALAY